MKTEHYLNQIGINAIDVDLKVHPDDMDISEFEDAILKSKADTAEYALHMFKGADVVAEIEKI